MVPSTLRSGTAPFGNGPSSADVHGARAGLHGRIDAHDVAGDDAVVRVDVRPLPDEDILGLRLGNLHFGFQPSRVRDAGEVAAGSDLLPHVHRDRLQHAGDARTHVQFVELPRLQGRHGTRLVDDGLLHRNLRGAGVGTCRKLFVRKLPPDSELLGVELRLPPYQFADQLPLGERIVHVCLHARLLVIALDGGDRRPLLERIGLQLDAKVGQRRLGGLQLETWIPRASCSSCGLDSSSRMVSGATVVPGCTIIRSTRASDGAAHPAQVLRHESARARAPGAPSDRA